jgi:hypothetical protein
MAVTDVAKALAADIVARDIRATIDPQIVQPPCVVVVPDGLTFRLSGDCADYRFNLYAIAPGVRIADSLPVLDSLIDALKDLVTIGEVRAGSFPFGDGEVPAYICPVIIDADW